MSFDSALIPEDEVLLEDLQDPEFREDWNKTAPARWLAIELAHYRAEHGLTQAQLAEHLGVDPEDVERMEDGTENPSLQELMCIAQRLGIEIMIDIHPADREPELPRRSVRKRSTSVSYDGMQLVMATA